MCREEKWSVFCSLKAKRIRENVCLSHKKTCEKINGKTHKKRTFLRHRIFEKILQNAQKERKFSYASAIDIWIKRRYIKVIR